jgi:transposase
MAWSTDVRLREAIVRAWHEEKLTYAAIASLMGVGEATVSRVLRRYRETASVAPRARGGGNRSPIRGEVVKALEELIAKSPDATLDELTQALMASVPVSTSRSAVLRALQRYGYSRKKRPSPPSSETRRSDAPTGSRSAPG